MVIIKEILQAQHWASVVGFILLVLGSGFTFYGSFRSGEKEKKELTDVITSKNETIEKIKDKVELQSLYMDKLREQNTELNGQLLNATKELSKAVTGSESYCRIEMNAQDVNNPDHFWINVLNETNYPLRDITMRYYDLNNPPPLTLEGVMHSKSIGNLKEGSMIPAVLQVTLNRGIGFSCNFFFTSNGPQSAHLIRKQFVNGKWITAERLSVNMKEIYTKIDPDFPEQDPAILFR